MYFIRVPYSFGLMVPTVQDAGDCRAVVYKLNDEQRINYLLYVSQKSLNGQSLHFGFRGLQ
jgi:hypothetical protein